MVKPLQALPKLGESQEWEPAGGQQGNGQHWGCDRAQTTEGEGGVLKTRPTRSVSGARHAATKFPPPTTSSSSSVNHHSQRARPAQTHCPPPTHHPSNLKQRLFRVPGQRVQEGGSHVPHMYLLRQPHRPRHHATPHAFPGSRSTADPGARAQKFPQPQGPRRATQDPSQMPSRHLPSARRGRKGRRSNCSDLISAPCASIFK